MLTVFLNVASCRISSTGRRLCQIGGSIWRPLARTGRSRSRVFCAGSARGGLGSVKFLSLGASSPRSIGSHPEVLTQRLVICFARGLLACGLVLSSKFLRNSLCIPPPRPQAAGRRPRRPRRRARSRRRCRGGLPAEGLGGSLGVDHQPILNDQYLIT